MSRLKAILWDLDNTLLPSGRLVEKILQEIFPSFGLIPPSLKEIHATMSGDIFTFLKRHSHDYQDQESVWKAFDGAQHKYYDVIELYEGALEAVAAFAAQGYQQAIVTSRGHEGRGSAGAGSIVGNAGLKPFIKTCITGDDVKSHKPDPEPLLLALSHLEVAPENAVMIGDHPDDMAAGKNAGTKTIGIDHEGDDITVQNLYEGGADTVIKSAHELEKAVHKLIGKV